MKIRFDFVTNSSSSSFVAFTIKNKELAEICSKYWIPVKNDGKTISGIWSAEEGARVVGTPGFGSISEWFEGLIDPAKNDVFQLQYNDFSDAIEYVKKHKVKIDSATEFSEIDSAYVVSDGGDSYISIERREKGVISAFEAEEWNYNEMGVALWELLEGYTREEYYQPVLDYAKTHGDYEERMDPWYEEESEESIFDSFGAESSLQGKRCCLTGDFAYGSKGKVEKYITAQGGSVSSSVTKDTQILVVGTLGSTAWTHKNYGSKVEKAIEYRNHGEDILIIREKDLFAEEPIGDESAFFDSDGPLNEPGEADKQNATIQELIEKINNMAVDPETEELSLKTIAVSMYKIDGQGVYDPGSERYRHIDKSFLDKVRLGWVSGDYTEDYKKELLAEEKRKKWAEHLQTLYRNAIDDTGMLLLDYISSKSDYALVMDSVDSAVDKTSLGWYLGENIDDFNSLYGSFSEEERETAKLGCFISYLKQTISRLKESNQDRGNDKPPVKVIWESQFHDYLMKHTSIGGITPEPVIGPRGTVRKRIPENHKEAVNRAIRTMISRWPERVINPKTRTYANLVKDITECYTEAGYVDIEEFLDAYGFSVRQDEVKKDANKEGDYEFEKNSKNEVTILRYTGEDTEVDIPDSIDGGIVKTIGKEAFTSNNRIEIITVPDSVTTIRGGAFGLCMNLKKVHLSDKIDKLVAGTFDACEKLEEINIPDGIATLPTRLFRDCPIRFLHIGRSLAEVTKDVFYEGEPVIGEQGITVYTKTCAVEAITIDPENKSLRNVGSMLLTEDGKVLIAMLGGETSCEIPEGVEIVYDNAFARMGNLKEVVFPDSLWLIGNKAFLSTGIESISLPGSLKVIGAHAFDQCYSLKTVNFSEGLEKIYNNAFQMTGITEVVFPESLNNLGIHSFNKWQMNRVEPSKWDKEIRRWGISSTNETVKTDHYIREMKTAARKAAAQSQLDNKIGFGLLASMMACLQSDAARSIEAGDRLKLEQIVISKDMESALGTNLKLVLSYYKANTTEKLSDCISYLKTEVDEITLNEYFKKIREAFPDNKEMEVLLAGVSKRIREEA